MIEKLPLGWKLVNLGDFCNLFYGKGLSTRELIDEGYPVYGANGIIGCYSEYLFEESKLIISCRGSLSGTIHKTKSKSFVTSNSIIIESVIPQITNDFLEIAINYVDKSSIITGSAQPQITIQNLRNLKIPIPPIDDQKNIVEKVNYSFSKLTSLLPVIESISTLSFKIKRKVINDLVSGDLTNKLRQNLQSGKLDNLLQEYIRNRISKNSKVKLSKDYMEIDTVPETKVPETWCWTRMVNLGEIIGGITKGKKIGSQISNPYPYLRVANVQDGYLDLSEIKQIDVSEKDYLKYKLEFGDILFTEGGDRDKLGRGTIWKNEIKNCIHQNHIFRARVDSNFINPEYLSIYTKSDFAKEYFYNNASQTVNLASINLTTLSHIPVPVPQIEEQRAIVIIYNKVIKSLEDVTIRQKKVIELIHKTKKLILDKVFLSSNTSNIKIANDAIDLIENEKINNIQNKNQISNLKALKTILEDYNQENRSKTPKPYTQNKIRKPMTSRPIENPSELVTCLKNLGGAASPEALLLACNLEEDIDLFFDFLRDSRDNKVIEVPIGHDGLIKSLL